jgi:hypothetical protein
MLTGEAGKRLDVRSESSFLEILHRHLQQMFDAVFVGSRQRLHRV